MTECKHPVRQYDERGRPYCGQCGASLIEQGYAVLPGARWYE